MVDFNKGLEIINKFHGSEKKISILYENEVFMLKFPDPIREKKNLLSYMNNHFSEFIGCKIFKLCGFDTQETLLGTYTDKKGRVKIVVGCKDFTQDSSVLYEFSKIANAIVESDMKLGVSIESVVLAVNNSDFIKNKKETINRFWDMFIIDTIIGNPDRHFDNWGILEQNGEIRFAPIYDCGSSLGALLDDSIMHELLTDTMLPDFKNKEYNVTSCYFLGGKRIFYHEIFKNPPNDIMESIKRTVPKIQIDRINDIVDSVEQMSDVRKKYLKKTVSMRYEQILLPTLKRFLRMAL